MTKEPHSEQAYMPCHQYQRDKVLDLCGGLYETKVLNVASKEDPAHLGRDFAAVNLDIEDFDIETRTNLYTVPNFIQGTATDLPFPDETFNIVVIGELLEHCLMSAAIKVLSEAKRVLRHEGSIVLTFPKDSRDKRVQRPPHELREYEDGITSWHQVVWDTEQLKDLLHRAALEVSDHTLIRYAVCDHAGVECWGYGMVLVAKEITL